MSLKNIFGLNGTCISEHEIVRKISDAQKRNSEIVEIKVDGKIVRVFLPVITK